MKKLLTVMLMMAMLACTAAAADTLDILKPIWLNALEGMREGANTPAGPIAEPPVTSGDEQLEVVRSAVYMQDQHDTEAYVYAELRNTGESIIRVNGATLTILDGSGRQVSKREYASVKPDVVMPGESLYVSEWLYDFVSDLSRVSQIEVSIERSQYSRKQIEKLTGARAYIDGNYLYAELENTTEAPLFNVAVIAVAADQNGRIVDMLREETYSGLGIAPGSTIIFRKYLQQHAMDTLDASCEAVGYGYSE